MTKLVEIEQGEREKIHAQMMAGDGDDAYCHDEGEAGGMKFYYPRVYHQPQTGFH